MVAPFTEVAAPAHAGRGAEFAAFIAARLHQSVIRAVEARSSTYRSRARGGLLLHMEWSMNALIHFTVPKPKRDFLSQ